MLHCAPNGSRFAALLAALVIGSAVLLPATGADSLAAPAPSSSQPAEGGVGGGSAGEQLEKTVRELQAEWSKTRAALEQLHRSTESEARQQAEQLSQQLAKLEKDLETQRQEKEQVLKMVEAANQQTLIYAVLFIGIALVAILVISLFQIRATTKLTALAINYADRLNLNQGPSMPAQIPASPETEHLLRSLDRLQHRIDELESTASRSLVSLPERSTGPKPAIDAATPPPSLPAARIDSPKAAFVAAVPVSVSSTASPEGRSPQPDDGKSTQQAMISGILGKGEALLKMGQAKPALIAFEEALRIDLNHVEAWVKKGSALEKLERMEEALACYDRAIALDGTSTLAYLYKGGVCNRLERFDEALACYEQALKSHDRMGVPEAGTPT